MLWRSQDMWKQLDEDGSNAVDLAEFVYALFPDDDTGQMAGEPPS